MKYDFDSILQRLKDGLQGSVSAMEGTFTGDILQAVAAELARIWSQEMDSVTQRAFISSAEGAWLDAACGDFGIVRKEEETDAQLRQRALERIRQQGAGGNTADYVTWAQELEGVAAASAVALGRGAGTVDVYFSPTEDAPANLKQLLQAHLESRRPVGADVQVIRAQPVSVSVAAQVSTVGDIPMEDISAAFSAVLERYLLQSRLAGGGQTVSINRIISLLMGCSGVADVGSITLNGGTVNLEMAQGTYAVVSSVTLTEAEHV